jgi:hypothetical protein
VNLALYAKAFTAAGMAGAGALMAGMADGHLTGLEWLSAAIAALSALGTVYAVPNAKVPQIPLPVPLDGTALRDALNADARQRGLPPVVS